MNVLTLALQEFIAARDAMAGIVPANQKGKIDNMLQRIQQQIQQQAQQVGTAAPQQAVTGTSAGAGDHYMSVGKSG
jgi:transcriptional regulator of nitric oxide reductase